jgi:transketolase
MTAPESMRDRFYRVASELLDEHPRLSVVLADIGVAQLRALGAFDRHPRRVINAGIREQLMVSIAAGMALEGMRPIVHSYTPFLVERPFEQIKLDFAHQGVGGIFVSVGASYDWAAGGRTHQCPGDVALLSSLPGFAIRVPGHPDEAEAFLRSAAETDAPVYIRLSDQSNAAPILDTAVDGIVLIRRGSSLAATVLAVGPMLDRTIAATRDLDVSVLYAATVRPLDGDVLRSVALGPDLIVVEPCLEGTALSALAKALDDRPRRFLSIGVPHEEHRHYGTSEDHDRAHGLDSQGIRERMARFLHARARPLPVS